MAATRGSAASGEEIRRFDALAGQWWDPAGPMRPLHAMNRLRVEWIDTRVRARFGAAVAMLDVGCGGGLATESLARRGHRMTGLDAAGEAIAVARHHAAAGGFNIKYWVGVAHDLVGEGSRFDAITCLEVIEHVPDPAAFLADLVLLLKPGGLLFLSTLNRTRRSWVMAILGAEYVLRMLPPGTHHWRHFMKPGELAAALRGTGLGIADIAGMAPDPLRGGWRTSRHTGVNYIVMAASGAASEAAMV